MKIGDRVRAIDTKALEYNVYGIAGTITAIDESDNTLMRVLFDDEDTVWLYESELRLVEDTVLKHIAESILFTGKINKQELEDEATNHLNDMQLSIEEKAKKYDKIAETLWMSTGMIEDGDSIKFIVNPEITLQAIVNIITDADIQTSKDLYEATRLKKMERIGKW